MNDGTNKNNSLSVGTQPEPLTAEAWEAGDVYSATITADPGDGSPAKWHTVRSYDEYLDLRQYFQEKGWTITAEAIRTNKEAAEALPGLFIFDAAADIFATANDEYINIKHFPKYSEMAKIKLHDNVVLAADTGAGKSSLALNFLNDLNEKYPVMYFNLEMDALTVLRRLAAIAGNMELDRVERYQRDTAVKAQVDLVLKNISTRQPLQIIDNLYNLDEIENAIKNATKNRRTPTIVIIDHSLLITLKNQSVSRYERFTKISEDLRRIAKLNNIILFSLLQQSREGKKDEAKKPTNSSLKESGSWENDSTHITFLWWDPKEERKKLIITKNRNGENGEVTLNYWSKKQIYQEAKDQPAAPDPGPQEDKDGFLIAEPGDDIDGMFLN